MYKGGIVIDNVTTMEVPFWNKVLLTVEEASKYFGIGENRLRDLVHDDYGSKYHLMLGRTIKIKRRPFEEFIEQVEQI